MKAQSEFIAFLIALILIVLIVIPLFYVVLDYSKPASRQLNFQQVLQRQVNGGSILILFNSTPTSSSLVVLRGNANYTVNQVFYENGGVWYNITNSVMATVFSNGVNQVVTKNGNPLRLPLPLIYNFSLPGYVWKYTVVVQLSGYNVSIFATLLPNETAYTS
jgi:hypothetical protein